MVVLLPFLISVAIAQVLLAATCLRQFPRTRLPAAILLAAALFQVVAVLYGERWLLAMHTPSSFDAPADGFEVLAQAVLLTVLSVAFCSLLCVWIAASIAMRRE